MNTKGLNRIAKMNHERGEDRVWLWQTECIGGHLWHRYYMVVIKHGKPMCQHIN